MSTLELPSTALRIADGNGQDFGHVRIVPVEGRAHADCIIDVEPTTPAQAARSEVRWLCKRHYQRYSEHRLTVADDGAITIRKGSFSVRLVPDEEAGGFRTEPPAPPLRARWDPPS